MGAALEMTKRQKKKIFIFSFSMDSWKLFLIATSAAYKTSQIRGQIGAAAEAYATATVTRNPGNICDLHRSLR